MEFSSLDIALSEPFGIATGAQVYAANVLIVLTLSDGSVGLGEAAPFPAVSGETQQQVLSALPEARAILLGQNALRYRHLSHALWESLAAVPSAIAGIEVALLDALCRHAAISLCHFFGATEDTLTTDITIPTASTSDPIEHAGSSARRARSQGFRTLKIKVGREDIDTDAARVRAVAKAAADCSLILDANGAYNPADALRLLANLGTARTHVTLFEQPVARTDFAGLVEVEAKGGLLVAADESLRCGDDLRRMVREGGPGAVNIKTAKSGLIGGFDLAVSAKSLGFRLMIGGMVESELSMSASACLAAGLGGFDFVDLDTPLFMGARPFVGGTHIGGPALRLTHLGLGHGVSMKQS